MPAIAEDAFFKLPKSSLERFNGVLLYGSDETQLSSVQRRIIRGSQNDEDPLFLTMAAVRADASVLESAFRGMSLFGGRRLIVVEGVDENSAKLFEPIFAAEDVANYVVAVAGQLNKSSQLRGSAEASSRFHAIGFYEEGESAFLQRVNRVLQAAQHPTEEGVAERLAELSGGDRGVLEGEVAKLSLYVGEGNRITRADVEALCGDASAFDVTSLLEAMLAGDLEAAETALSAARSNEETAQMLNAMKWPLDRMQSLRVGFEQSNSWEQAFSRARPPVHFTVKDRWRSLLSRLSSSQLDHVQRRMQETILLGRRQADIADAVVERFIFATTREMRISRR